MVGSLHSNSLVFSTKKYLCRRYLNNFLTRPGPFTDPDFVSGTETIASLEASKVLLVRIFNPEIRASTNLL